ncbi:MAG: hypothetical protein ACT4OX_00505 [Actinomycetota bacterium]
MTVIRVHPESIRDYAANAQRSFDEMRVTLERLVRSVVEVRYFGPNAAEFKRRCGELATDFAVRLSQDLGAIADAVRVSTSNIAASLGGQVISIQVNGSAIVPPAVPQGDGAVDVDVSGLEALKQPVRADFASIEAALDEHLRRLISTDWVGTAKDVAVEAVTGFTNGARANVANARGAITQYLDQQIGAVETADR